MKIKVSNIAPRCSSSSGGTYQDRLGVEPLTSESCGAIPMQEPSFEIYIHPPSSYFLLIFRNSSALKHRSTSSSNPQAAQGASIASLLLQSTLYPLLAEPHPFLPTLSSSFQITSFPGHRRFPTFSAYCPPPLSAGEPHLRHVLEDVRGVALHVLYRRDPFCDE